MNTSVDITDIIKENMVKIITGKVNYGRIRYFW